MQLISKCCISSTCSQHSLPLHNGQRHSTLREITILRNIKLKSTYCQIKPKTPALVSHSFSFGRLNIFFHQALPRTETFTICIDAILCWVLLTNTFTLLCFTFKSIFFFDSKNYIIYVPKSHINSTSYQSISKNEGLHVTQFLSGLNTINKSNSLYDQ